MNAVERIRTYMRSHGAAYTLHRLRQIFSQRYLGTYDRRREREKCPPEELEAQRRNPPGAGLISVIVPIYNTDPRMLQELLDSLAVQTYPDFEAILYDGASDLAATRAVLDGAKDRHFRVIHAAENRGISGNTNEALRLSRGEYVVLCDHDDRMAPDALWRFAEAIIREHPDVIYADEDRITENSRRHMDPHYKPDWNPEFLLCDNYICHPAAVRRELIMSAGGLRSGFDGSQDHDLFLRLSEKTDRFCHIPRVLYTWREVSASRSHRDLQTCLETGCRALESHAERCGWKAAAVPVSKVIRPWFEVDPEAPVEVLIHGLTEDDCRACLAELDASTSWRNLSAVLVVTDGPHRFAALNQAAAESEAAYLLVLESNVRNMNRHFIREMMMYAQMEHVAGVTPVLTDARNRITHGGFALGVNGIAACCHEGLRASAGGVYDIMNKVHNVSAVSPCCMLVRKSAWAGFDPAYRTGLAGADLGLTQLNAGRRFVITPYASAIRERDPLLLSGTSRDEQDMRRFRTKWGDAVHDPCYSMHFNHKKADYAFL